MKNVDQAIEEHMRELREFYILRPQDGSDVSDEDGGKLISALEEAAARPAPVGRPPAWRSKNPRTYQSFESFLILMGEYGTYRLRNGNVKRLPSKLKSELMKFALEMCPDADEELVVEHLRKNRHLLPKYEEPTCFILVRHEFDDGRIAAVIIAAPANLRRGCC